MIFRKYFYQKLKMLFANALFFSSLQHQLQLSANLCHFKKEVTAPVWMDPIAIGATQEAAIGEGDEEGAEVGVAVGVVEDTIGMIIGKDPIV